MNLGKSIKWKPTITTISLTKNLLNLTKTSNNEEPKNITTKLKLDNTINQLANVEPFIE